MINIKKPIYIGTKRWGYIGSRWKKPIDFRTKDSKEAKQEVEGNNTQYKRKFIIWKNIYCLAMLPYFGDMVCQTHQYSYRSNFRWKSSVHFLWTSRQFIPYPPGVDTSDYLEKKTKHSSLQWTHLRVLSLFNVASHVMFLNTVFVPVPKYGLFSNQETPIYFCTTKMKRTNIYLTFFNLVT